MFWQYVHDAVIAVLRFERRFDPFFRPALDAVLREPAARLVQYLINRRRQDDGLALGEEREQPDEAGHLDTIIATMAAYMKETWPPGNFQRAGNTKTHAILRGEVIVRDDLPTDLRHGVFAEPKSYRAWVRLAGPGPDWPRDIDDVGVLSCAIKLMGVDGPKLLDDEKFTQDFLSISIPTFTTPDTRANAKLQAWILKRRPFFYFIDPNDSHLLDALMQGLWSKTQSNPLGERYWSCVPYRLGEKQAMMYSFQPRSSVYRKIPRLPLAPPDNYLRENIARTLSQQDVVFDILVQLQQDPFRMPIENASVRWPETLSPFLPVAELRIPRQTFNTPAQLAFADNLSFNPWHCIAEHRPLGNQNRARRRLYFELSRYRQEMNRHPHVEPTGDEAFS